MPYQPLSSYHFMILEPIIEKHHDGLADLVEELGLGHWNKAVLSNQFRIVARLYILACRLRRKTCGAPLEGYRMFLSSVAKSQTPIGCAVNFFRLFRTNRRAHDFSLGKLSTPKPLEHHCRLPNPGTET